MRLRRRFLANKGQRSSYRLAEAVGHYFRCGVFFNSNGQIYLIGYRSDSKVAYKVFWQLIREINLATKNQPTSKRGFKAGACEAVADHFRRATTPQLPWSVQCYLTRRIAKLGRTRAITVDSLGFDTGYSLFVG